MLRPFVERHGGRGAPLSRRALLGGVAGLLAALSVEGSALAQPSDKLRAVRRGGGKRGPRGTTLMFALDSAPFAREKYKDATVLVYVPAHYRLPANGAVDAVVHFHGMRYTAERAAIGHVLREQLDDSGQNAILVIPQLAVMAPDASAGQLETPGGFARLLTEVLREVRRQPIAKLLGAASLKGAQRFGHVCVSAHSGGYNAAACCLEHGGVDVRECWLFDALYARVEVFRRWVLAATGDKTMRHKLVSFHAGGSCSKNSLELQESLRAAGIDCRDEKRPGELSRADLVDAQALFIATPADHVGAVFAQNNLRDCLYASVLERDNDGAWFANFEAPRKIDRRGGG